MFGCPTFVHIDNRKLESKSKRCLFLGYKSSVKGYKLWDLEVSKVVISRNVIFYEIIILRGLSFKESNPTSQQSFDIQMDLTGQQSFDIQMEFEINNS